MPLGVASVQATRQNDDLENQVRVLREDNDASREELEAEADFVLTLSGSCVEPGERLRVSITEDDNGACHNLTCTALVDLEADRAGAIPSTAIDVRGDIS